MLEYKQKKYKEGGMTLTDYECKNYMVRTLKKEYEWLKEPDKWALDNSVFNMCKAYKNFFKEKNKGFPKFKSKHRSKKSYMTTCVPTGNTYNIVVDFEEHKIKLPKLCLVKYKGSLCFKGVIKSATISQRPSGKYYVSVLVDENTDLTKPEITNKIGIDLGLSNFAILSTGEKVNNPKHLYKSEQQLK